MNSYGPPNVVDITNPFKKSLQGKYYMGETDQLQPTDSNRVWGALVNPPHSGVHLYFDMYVISNLSHDPLVAQICFCDGLPTHAMMSHEVTATNLTIHPRPTPCGQVHFGSELDPTTLSAVPVSTRVIPGYSSLSSEKVGRWIFGPGQSLLFTLTGAMNRSTPAVLSFGWWEEPIGHY